MPSGVSRCLEPRPAGRPLRRARAVMRRTRPSRSVRVSASGMSALHSGRPHRSGGGATDDRMNLYAQTGHDPEFSRGSTMYQNHNGDASAGGANPNLGRIATAPFYAVRLYPSDIGTSSGLVTDEVARVLDAGNQPIAGL